MAESEIIFYNDSSNVHILPSYVEKKTNVKGRWLEYPDILTFLTQEFPSKSEEYYRRELAQGSIRIVNAAGCENNGRLRMGDIVIQNVIRAEPYVPCTPLSVLYLDKDVCVIDKPSGILVHASANVQYLTCAYVLRLAAHGYMHLQLQPHPDSAPLDFPAEFSITEALPGDSEAASNILSAFERACAGWKQQPRAVAPSQQFPWILRVRWPAGVLRVQRDFCATTGAAALSSMHRKMERCACLAHELRPIHRLDKNTSGVCVFARSATAAAVFGAALAAKSQLCVPVPSARSTEAVQSAVEQPTACVPIESKRYWALTHGSFPRNYTEAGLLVCGHPRPPSSPQPEPQPEPVTAEWILVSAPIHSIGASRFIAALPRPWTRTPDPSTHAPDRSGGRGPTTSVLPIQSIVDCAVCAATDADARSNVAMTLVRVLRRSADLSLVECVPISGRTHQLRTHLWWLGHPIANDHCYGGQLCSSDCNTDAEGFRGAAAARRACGQAEASIPCEELNTDGTTEGDTAGIRGMRIWLHAASLRLPGNAEAAEDWYWQAGTPEWAGPRWREVALATLCAVVASPRAYPTLFE